MISPVGMITGIQIRAARTLLRWTIRDLAREAGLSVPTVQRAEVAEGVPVVQAQTLAAIQDAIERAGVIFLAPSNGSGRGVRLRA